MISKNDWRLTNQIDYMEGVKLKRSHFPEDTKSDHEHCEFCWEKFDINDDSLKDGYCTLDGYRWICNECFEDFKEMFKWDVVE